MALDQVDVDKLDEQVAKEMSFLEHLEQLRWHLVRSIVALVVVSVIVFLNKDLVFNDIIQATKEKDFITYRVFCSFSDFIGLGETLCMTPPLFQLSTREFGEMFIVHLKVSIVLGFIFAFPYIFWEIWRFIKPGLYSKEQKAARGIVFVCSILFMLGVSFGYFIVSPFAINFLGGYQIDGVIATPTISSFVGYMTMFTLPTGLIFELPVVVYFFAKIGLVTAEGMRSFRRIAIVVILVISAIITPPDWVSQMLISFPLYMLYEISIFIAKRVNKSEDQ